MSAPENQPPFRMPCEGVSGKPLRFSGRPFQHSLTPVLVHKFANTTVVPNPLGGADIPPFEQWAADPGSGCGSYFMPTGVAWAKPYPVNVFTDTGDFVDMALRRKRGFKNVFARRQWHGIFPWTAPEARCATNCPPDSATESYVPYQPTPTQTKYLTLVIAAVFSMSWDDTDGTTIYESSSSASGGQSVNANSGVITNSQSTAQDDQNEPDSHGGTADPTQTLHVLNGAGWDLDGGGMRVDHASGMSTNMDGLPATDVHCGHVAMPTNPFFGTGLTLTQLLDNWNAIHPDVPFPAISDPNSYDHTVTFAFVGAESGTYRISWSRSATVYSWNVSYSADPGDGQSVDFSGSLTLSNPNTAASIKADLISLLAYCRLDEDEFYPWRTDLKTGVAPLLSRNEAGGNVSPLGFNVYGWVDPNAALFDGSIVGIPNGEGVQDYFNFGFQDVRGCCYKPGDGSQTWSWNLVGTGQNVSTFNGNTGCHLPLNTTQWANWFQSINKPPCAFMFYSDQADYYGAGCVTSSGAPSKAGDAGAFVMGKWAEILELWPSQNFAMPAGDAKFWFDETRVYCATITSGSGEGATVSLTDPTSGLAVTDIEVDDVWGGPVVGGFYHISAFDGAGNVTLGTKLFDVPSNWKSKSDVGPVTIADETHTDADFCFGALRWSDKPSVLGRAAVTTSGPGTAFTFATAQPAFGMALTTSPAAHQEQVDLYNASMTLLASNVTAVRDSDTTFHLTGTGYPTAVWVQINGSAKWYVNDTNPKGDGTVLEWTADLRTPGEYNILSGAVDCDGAPLALPTANAGGGPPTLPFKAFSQTQFCLPFVPCAPKVICISPNGETFANGITYDFPSEFLLDEQYGSKWWKKVESTMTDLFWQRPHRPCNIETCAQWAEDDGSCTGNAPGSCPATDEAPAPIYYYAHRPQVEARLTVPSNYGVAQDEAGPALPTGIQIGWLSPVDHDTGDVALPPVAPLTDSSTGTPGGANTPWNLHNMLCEDCPTFGYHVPGC